MFLSLGIALGPSPYSSVYVCVCLNSISREMLCLFFLYLDAVVKLTDLNLSGS